MAYMLPFVYQAVISAAVSYAISYAMAPDGQDIEGPKLENLKVGRSQYGASIARVYGTMRVPGQMVWFKNNQLNHYVYWTDAGGGKGGPDSGSMTNHVYTITGAWVMCEGEIDAVRRVWAGNILIYDASKGATGNQLMRAKQMYRDLRIYLGDSTQEPDSLIVADKGHSPAYRGLAYAVFDDLEAKKFGNSIPDLKFEVVRNAASDPGGVLFATGDVASGALGTDSYYPAHNTGPTVYWKHTTSATTAVLMTDFDGDLKGRLPPENGADLVYPTGQGFVNGYDVSGSNWDNSVTDGFTLVGTKSGVSVELHGLLPADEIVYSTVYAADDTHVMVFTKAAGAGSGSKQLAAWHLLTIYDGTAVLIDSGTVATGIFSGDISGRSKSGVLSSGFHTEATVLEPDLKHVWYGAGTTGSPVRCYEIDDAGELSEIIDVNTSISAGAGARPGIYAEGGVCTMLSGLGLAVVTRVERWGQDAQDLGLITSDLMQQAGLESGDIDVSQLTGTTCDGYAIMNRETLRSDIEPLMTFGQFDFVESGSKLKAVPRGSGTIASLTENDLAAHEYGSDRPEKLTERVKLEEELLKEVSITFIDKARDYNDGQTHATQLNTDSVNKISQKFAIAMTRDRATQLANILLDHSWLTRRSFEFKLPPKFSYLEPTDPITITRDGQTVTLRITRIEMGANGIMECEGEMYAESVYTSEAVGADIDNPDTANLIYGPTIPYFLDIPLVRGQQSGTLETGYYIAATGLYDTWPGASGFVSTDGRVTFNSFGAVSISAIMGRCDTTLGSSDTGALDYTNTLRVELLTPGATLESVTVDAMKNGRNWAIVGNGTDWEVIKFQTVTLVGTGVSGGNIYDLTVLSRGRRGTEHLVGTHGAGESFILIDDRVQRIPMDEDRIGQTYSYAAVTYGADIQDAIIYDFANTAISMRPYSPSHVEGTRDGSDNLTITWKRRTRYGGEWRNSVDITDSDPMTFEVDIMNGSTVVRTISVTAETASYTAAEQTTDFGSTQSSLTVRVYQLNTVFGRGLKTEETI